MRRGYGDSGGDYAEDSGPCGHRDYSLAARGQRPTRSHRRHEEPNRRDASGMIAVGVSAGGFATVALTSDPPAGLAAAISFAGSRGSRADNDVCDQDALVREFAALGRTSRIPMLWIYARNDKFFWPDLAHRMHAAFAGAGAPGGGRYAGGMCGICAGLHTICGRRQTRRPAGHRITLKQTDEALTPAVPASTPRGRRVRPRP